MFTDSEVLKVIGRKLYFAITSYDSYVASQYIHALNVSSVCSTQVYLKELERQKLQDTLHKDVMRKIIFLQRWFRARLQRKDFLDMRQAAILIQVTRPSSQQHQSPL